MIDFGRTGLQVSRLCFGTGSHGNPGEQSQLPIDTLAGLLVRGWQAGIRFWDTALSYGTHAHVAEALRRVPRDQVVVTTKFRRVDGETGLRKCLSELDTPYIDILLLHEVDSRADWDARQPVLQGLRRAKTEGLVRAVGLSTHSIELLEFAAERPELDVLFTNLNHAHVHMDADIKHYAAALRRAHAAGQGVYVHKTLGEGALAGDVARALHHNLGLDYVHSVCVGLKSDAELDATLAAAQVFHTVG